MPKVNNSELKRARKLHEAKERLQKKWEEILTESGFSMNRGVSDRLSYAGSSSDLGVIEKLNAHVN